MWIAAILPVAMAQQQGNQFSRDLVDLATRATVIIKSANSTGTGFFISQDGFILTNYHVIRGAACVQVHTKEGGTYPVAYVLAISEVKDLALLKISVKSHAFLEMASAGSVKLGAPVFTIGHPHGHYWTFSQGYVAGERVENGVNVVQFSADISPGSSGGPVVTSEGKVCGIATYLELQQMIWDKDRVTLDPSEVLKFGVSSAEFCQILERRASFKNLSMAQLANHVKMLDVLNVFAAVQVLTSDLVTDLGAGIGELKIAKYYVYGTAKRRTRECDFKERRVEVRKTKAVSINVTEFNQALVRFAALTTYFDSVLPGKSGHVQLDEAIGEWRGAVEYCRQAVDELASAQGKSTQTYKDRLGRGKFLYNQGIASYCRSLRLTQGLLKYYGSSIQQPLVDRQAVGELADYYFENGYTNELR